MSLWLGNLSVLKMAVDRRSYLKKSPKCLPFSIASCSNDAEIHSVEFLYFREKTNWFSKEVRPLRPYKNEDKHILQEPGRGEGKTDI